MGKKAKKTAKAFARAEHEATGQVAKARDAAPVAVIGRAGELADQPPLFALSGGALALGLLTRNRQLVRTGARMLVAEAVATGIKGLVKRSIDRARPARALEDGAPELGHGRGAKDTAFNSLPSGHTAGAVAVAQALAHESGAAATPVRLAAGAVGAIQLPRGKHYLSDVAVGAAIGWIAERVAGVAVDAGERGWAHWRARRAAADPVAETEAHPS